MGVTVQGEHDGLEEEDRSDPEGRGAHGPARPTLGRAGKESMGLELGAARLAAGGAVVHPASTSRAFHVEKRERS